MGLFDEDDEYQEILTKENPPPPPLPELPPTIPRTHHFTKSEMAICYAMGTIKRCSSRLVGMKDERKGAARREPVDHLTRLSDDIIGYAGELAINGLFGIFPDFTVFSGLKPDLQDRVHVRSVNHPYKGLIIRPWRENGIANRDQGGHYALMRIDGSERVVDYDTMIFDMEPPWKGLFVGWRHVNMDDIVEEALSHENDPKRKWILRGDGNSSDCIIVPPQALNHDINALSDKMAEIEPSCPKPKYSETYTLPDLLDTMCRCIDTEITRGHGGELVALKDRFDSIGKFVRGCFTPTPTEATGH